MVKLLYQNFGDDVVIGIRGSSETKVQHQFYSFWNHGASSMTHEPEINNNFLYFWSTPYRVKKALFSAEVCRILTARNLDESTPEIEKEAQLIADSRFDKMERETIFNPTEPNTTVYKVNPFTPDVPDAAC